MSRLAGRPQAAHIDPHFGSFRPLSWVFLHMGSFDLSNLIMTLTLLTEIMTLNGLESDYKRWQGEYQNLNISGTCKSTAIHWPRAERAVVSDMSLSSYVSRGDIARYCFSPMATDHWDDYIDRFAPWLALFFPWRHEINIHEVSFGQRVGTR